ncbi:MAG: hypothetical protein J6040_06455 [Clostridiales bacterium]|nr:hypothetical protein [Clostridiales bacterium]
MADPSESPKPDMMSSAVDTPFATRGIATLSSETTFSVALCMYRSALTTVIELIIESSNTRKKGKAIVASKTIDPR